MNYKLEKFWNWMPPLYQPLITIWTINLKSFEILWEVYKTKDNYGMNYKLEKFWNSQAKLKASKSFPNEL